MQRGLPEDGDVVAGKYVITRLLGRGGMGAVYVVEHRITGKKLALKCLLPEHHEQPEFVERFLREAQAAGRIEHRNVVDVFDVGQEGELIYIVMELLDGKPLSELLRTGALSLEETLQILLRAMDGVMAAHAVGIVHRDLKPDNILVCVGQSGRLDDPRVLDFGISKLEDDIGKPLTKSGVMLGTPYYMAFEQINSQRDLDQRVDVYAMGVILYEAMSGQLPYVAESVGALAIRMMSGPPTPLVQLRPDLPQGLAEVVMRSVARNRDERYASMRELREAIAPYCSESAVLLAPPGQGTPLGASMRASRGIDATVPALAGDSPSGAPMRESSRRLKLDYDDHVSHRAPTAGSSKTLLWVIAGAAALVLLGGALLIAMLRGGSSTPPAVPEAPARAVQPAVPPPRVEAPMPAKVEAPKNEPKAAPEEKREAAPVEAAPEVYQPAGEVTAPEALDHGARGKKKPKARGRHDVAELPTAAPSGAAAAPAGDIAQPEAPSAEPLAPEPVQQPPVEPTPPADDQKVEAIEANPPPSE